MVTIQDAVQYVNGVACTTQKVWCKSTDVKPTEGIGNGSQLREMDTGKDYAFDAESGEWLEQPSEGGGGGGGSSTLAGLTDVDLTNPTDGQTLVYDAASSKWVNGSGGGSSGILVVHVVEIAGTDNLRLDKTWQEIWDAQVAGVIVAISAGESYEGYTTWSCAPIKMVAVDEANALWSVYDNNSNMYNCLAPTDYPQTGIG